MGRTGRPGYCLGTGRGRPKYFVQGAPLPFLVCCYGWPNEVVIDKLIAVVVVAFEPATNNAGPRHVHAACQYTKCIVVCVEGEYFVTSNDIFILEGHRDVISGFG